VGFQHFGGVICGFLLAHAASAVDEGEFVRIDIEFGDGILRVRVRCRGLKKFPLGMDRHVLSRAHRKRAGEQAGNSGGEHATRGQSGGSDTEDERQVADEPVVRTKHSSPERAAQTVATASGEPADDLLVDRLIRSHRARGIRIRCVRRTTLGALGKRQYEDRSEGTSKQQQESRTKICAARLTDVVTEQLKPVRLVTPLCIGEREQDLLLFTFPAFSELAIDLCLGPFVSEILPPSPDRALRRCCLQIHVSSVPCGPRCHPVMQTCRMPIVDNAVYVNGVRTANPDSLEETYEVLRARHGMAWIGMYRPTPAEVESVAKEFDLHHLAVEDTLAGHQRPKLERYASTQFIVLQPARYLDASEEVEFGEVHMFIGPDFAITIRHAESPDLGRVRKRLEGNPKLLALGPLAIMYAVLDQVVDEYAPVVNGVENDIDEIEDQLFQDDVTVSRRIYELSREVIAFQRATQPLIGMLSILRERISSDDERTLELHRDLRDVEDHVIALVERVDGFRTLLQNALMVHATLVGQRQNEETKALTEASLAQGEQTKRISSWAAILFAPTLVASIYGMNFTNMPELHWTYGYPYAILLMVALGFGLYLSFKRRGWI
jgi:magnesium transporter